MGEVILSELTKVYDPGGEDVLAVDELDLSVRDEELLVVVGPSGCGKSTTLRMIAGLETVTDGTIEIGGREVQHLVPSRRSIAMVFQSYALYPKMTVRENMGYGLKHSSDLSEAEREDKVEETAELLQIEGHLDKVPSELSGGQKQRVALGRAIVREPEVFLLDEPLSNLDAKLRAHMRTELQRIHERIGGTTVYVTHDQKEAMTMADRIVIMNDGELQQVAPPEVAYDHPENEFVARFLGSPSMNLLDATVEERDQDYVFRTAEGGVEFASVSTAAVEGALPEQIRLGLRPEDLQISTDGDGTFAATVNVNQYQGKENFVHLTVDSEELTARIPPTVTVERGQSVGITVAPSDVYLFDSQSGESIKTRGHQSVTPSADQ